MDNHYHTKGDGSWWVNDVRGIPLARVCKGCWAQKLSKFKPEVRGISGRYEDVVEETIEPDE